MRGQHTRRFGGPSSPYIAGGQLRREAALCWLLFGFLAATDLVWSSERTDGVW